MFLKYVKIVGIFAIGLAVGFYLAWKFSTEEYREISNWIRYTKSISQDFRAIPVHSSAILNTEPFLAGLDKCEENALRLMRGNGLPERELTVSGSDPVWDGNEGVIVVTATEPKLIFACLLRPSGKDVVTRLLYPDIPGDAFVEIRPVRLLDAAP